MEIIAQNIENAQEVLSRILQNIPIVMATKEDRIYILIKNINTKLENFIYTGEAETSEFQVFSNDDMQAMSRHWTRLGLTVTYHRQQMGYYMQRKITITYPQVSDPATGMRVSLIPWFMLPGRPHPIFAYIYAIWHYRTSGEKSQRLSAAATEKLFGIDGFNKSTLCRSLRAGGIFEILQQDMPQTAIGCEMASNEDLIEYIPRLLKGCPSIKTLKEMLGGNTGQLSESVSDTENVRGALSGVPHEYLKVIKENGQGSANGKANDSRKRPSRPRSECKRPKRRALQFAPKPQIEYIRKGFITYCCSFVMSAAMTYHQVLL